MYTTLNQIRAASPCATGWKQLLVGLNKKQSDDVPLTITAIIDIVGFNDAVWCLKTAKGYDSEIGTFSRGVMEKTKELDKKFYQTSVKTKWGVLLRIFNRTHTGAKANIAAYEIAFKAMRAAQEKRLRKLCAKHK